MKCDVCDEKEVVYTLILSDIIGVIADTLNACEECTSITVRVKDKKPRSLDAE